MVNGQWSDNLEAQGMMFVVCAGLKGRHTLVEGVALPRKITTNKSAP